MKTKAITVFPSGAAWLVSKTAEQAVHITNETSIPAADQRNRVRRPSRSTSKAALPAAMKLKTCSKPLIRVCVSESVIPTVSRTRVR